MKLIPILLIQFSSNSNLFNFVIFDNCSAKGKRSLSFIRFLLNSNTSKFVKELRISEIDLREFE